MTHPHYIDREAQPVSNPYKFDSEIAWLQEAARYFAKRPTGGEDAAHWSNVYNAENANKIASRLDALSHTPAPMDAVAWRVRDKDDPRGWWLYGVHETETVAELKRQGHEVQALAVIPTPEDGRTG